MDYFLWAVAGLWLVGAAWCLVAVLSLRSLPAGGPADGPGPTVSVVVPARDEEARVETTVRRLLEQQGVQLQVIAVNDRSRDRTGAILDALAQAEPRVRAAHVTALPEGWLGKCHACHVGAAQATGDWLLFTDGDVWLQPDVIARAVRAARAAPVEHVCLTFAARHGTLAGRACQFFLVLSVANHALAVDRGRPDAHIGIGAFNLVSRSAYLAAGGYEPLRLTVVDDVQLGLLLRRAGFRTRAYLAGDAVDADWSASLPGLLQVLSKNHFAMTGYNTPGAVAGSALLLLPWLAAVLGPFNGTWAGLAAALGLASAVVPALAVAVRAGLPVAAALLAPLIFPVLPVSLLNSTWRTLRHGGVR